MWRSLQQRFKACPDTEPEQATIRLVLVAIWATYITWKAEAPPAAWLGVVVASAIMSLGILLAILIKPKKSVKRRIIGMLHDFGILSYMLYLMGEAAAPAFVVYLWVTIGNGIRYGTGYLYSAMVFSLIGFTCASAYSDYWSGHVDVSIGIYVGLIVLPLYVSKLVRQLNVALDQAKQANRAKSEFLASMSHEIRTPIHGVLGFLRLMRRTDLTAKQEKYLAPVEQSARNLLKIINEILDFSRIEAGHLSVAKEPISVREVLTSTVALLRPQAEDKRVSLNLEIDETVPERLISDPTRVSQIVSNLVNNAIKFTRQGSVTVALKIVSKSEGEIRLAIIVSDTGIGIPAAQLDKLFEPFHQAESGRNRSYGGTGLGLTITKNLVEAMNGVINVESEPGRFTKVTVELPLLVAPVSESTADSGVLDETASLGFDGRELSVLVVDDNDINRELLSALLESYHFTAEHAASGREALRACTERCFDIVFMDIHMADLDGVDTTKYLRALQEHQGVECFVIAVSADVVGKREKRFDDAGFDSFIAKPVEEMELVTILGGLFADRVQIRSVPSAGFQEGYKRVLDRNAGIRYASGDENLWRENLERMISRLPTQLRELRDALLAQQYEQAKQLAHHIAGSASYIAANGVTRVVRAMESACEKREQKRMTVLLNELEVESVKLKTEIEAEFSDSLSSSPVRGSFN